MPEKRTYLILVRRERDCEYLYTIYSSHIHVGVCLGMQTAVIEFARNVLDWKGQSQIVPWNQLFFK